MGGLSSLPIAPSLLMAAQAVSAAVQNTTAETPWNLPDVLIPANMWQPGVGVRVSQAGVYRSGLSQSITPRIRCGPASTTFTSRTLLAATDGPVSGLLNASSDTPWAAETVHVMQSDGTVLSSGRLFFSTSATAALCALVATRTSVAGIDRTVDNIIGASAQWSAASAANLILCSTFVVEVLKRQ